jgi:predicted secreted protein
MSVTSAIVLYAVLWFLILLMLLPIGVRSQEEAGKVEPGTPAGAPSEPMILRKMLWATGLAALLWGLVFWLIVGGVVRREHIEAFAPFAM